MKQLRFTLLAFLMVMVGLTACKKDEPEVLDAENLTIDLSRVDFGNGQVIGTIKASTNKGTLAYSITSQGAPANGNVLAGLAINPSTGVVTITNSLEVGRFACASANQSKYPAVVSITNGSTTKTVNVTILVGCEE